MILIITEEADLSTSLVIDWLLFFKIKFIRINENDELKVVFNEGNIKIVTNNCSFYISELKGVWYRRGFLNLKIKSVDKGTIDEFRKNEFIKLKEFIYYKLSKIPHINKFFNSDVNKLIVNDIAKSLGILVPFERILNNKIDLERINDIDDYITKSITGSLIFDYKDFYLVGYTSKINKKDKLPNVFFPSLIQKYIPKKYELRIFFLHGEFYVMAIFSQKDEKTKIDFRNYNKVKPNRNVPFKLPMEVEKKLTELMNKLDLNCGSIDMICTPKNEFVFLEVNPIGQYGMVSNPCNYYLHEKIASFFNKIV